MSTVLRLRLSPSPPCFKVEAYSPTKHKMDSLCANPSEHLSIQPTPSRLPAPASVSEALSLFVSLSAFLSPAVCLCLSVYLSICVSASVSIYSRVCIRYFFHWSAKLNMVAGLSCSRRCRRRAADAHFRCSIRSRHKLKKDISI